MKELLIQVLSWWEDAQYQEAYPGRNMYDEDPEMVLTAKALWLENFGNENPCNWAWINLGE
jgi:hypothetical protein